jgi:hypothetical protein
MLSSITTISKLALATAPGLFPQSVRPGRADAVEVAAHFAGRFEDGAELEAIRPFYAGEVVGQHALWISRATRNSPAIYSFTASL